MKSTHHCIPRLTASGFARRTLLFLLAALTWGAVAVPAARAENLLTITGAGETGQDWDSNEAVATSFVLSAPATNVTVTAPVQGFGATGQLWLVKTQIGPGTTIAHVVTGAAYSSAAGPPSFTVPSLAAGTYFLVLGIDTGFAVWPATAFANATVTAHYTASAGLDFRSNNTDDFTPESDFNALLGAGRLHLTVTGTPAPTSPVLSTAAYTASSPTLNAGAVYGFPIVSNTQPAPETLTVTSTSAGTILNGASAAAGNNLNTGFRTNINLTLPVGQSAEAQTLSLALGAFDDGLRLDYNGQTVLDFDFSNYTSIPAVNSMFGGGWTPWAGEGAPIVLELDARGLRLMVTATSNGTGTAAGVLTGQRVNILNYFTSDTYVPDPVDPDFVNGVQIGLYNRNQQGAWAISNPTLTATAKVIKLAGLWEFDDPANPAKATIGNDLIFEGTAPTRSASVADDFAGTLNGVMLTSPPANGNRIRANHTIAPNGGGAKVNKYTILADIYSPPASRSSWRSIFQSDTGNADDGDYFIQNSNDTLGTGFIGYSSAPINETRWTRLVITVDTTLSGGDVLTYVNGTPHHTHTGNPGLEDTRYSLSNFLYFFADNSGENAPLHVGALAIYDGVLTPAAVALLGSPGSTIPHPPAPRFDAAATEAGLTGPNAAPLATPHGDGVPNLLKFAFNMDLSRSDTRNMGTGGTSGLPKTQLVSVAGQTYLQVQFLRRAGSNLIYTPLKMSTLTAGGEQPLTATPQVQNLGGGIERVTINEPCQPGTTPKCFSRVRVTQR